MRCDHLLQSRAVIALDLFEIKVFVGGEEFGTGSGSSKKKASQMAARSALSNLDSKQVKTSSR